MNDLTMKELSDADSIRARILTIRGVQVMLDRDLAELYGVEVKQLNRQVIFRMTSCFSFPMTNVQGAKLAP